MIQLEIIRNKKQFWNIHQKYLYEMTQFYDDEMDAEGNYHYGYFDCYFAGDPERKAFYIQNENSIVGFALINRYSHLKNEIDYAMAEFTIFPMYRRHNYAFDAVKQIFSLYPGRWEIKYNLKNQKAVLFWKKTTYPYHPQMVNLNENECVLSFSTHETE